MGDQFWTAVWCSDRWDILWWRPMPTLHPRSTPNC